MSDSKTQVEDAVLVEKAKARPAAYEALYNRYYRLVFRFVFNRLQREEDSKDVTQLVFIQAYQQLNRWEDRGFAFSAWLLRIALHEIVNLARKNDRMRAIHASFSDVQEILSEVRQAQASNESLGAALNTLDEDDLFLVEMRFFEKRKLKDIAVIMDWSESNTRVRLHRALKRLKQTLENGNS